jgi:NAD(P)-dependent dehydrogenase (short-subunit alcohol dehydrogenase family)
MRRFINKTAVITGANSGIGLASVQRFLAEGATVYAFDRNIDEVSKITKYAVKGDVTKMSDIDKLYEEVSKNNHKLDVVFANAGVDQFCPFPQVTEAFFDNIMNINCKGLFFSVQKGLPLMNNGGSIILNASIASHKGLHGNSVYNASKAAVRSLARTLAMELGPRQIRANAINPGMIHTPIFKTLGMSEAQVAEMTKQFAALVPLGRGGLPEEIASTAAFLASEDGSYVNGIEIDVDGGWTQV